MVRSAPLRVVVFCAVMAVSVPSHGFIAKLYSLDAVLKESTNIVLGRVVSVDDRRRRAVAEIDSQLKGKSPYQKIQMNISVGQRNFPAMLMDRLEAGQPIVLFYRANGNQIACLGHVSGLWFQLFASHVRDEAKMWWRFTHIEIHMNRTFAGDTPALISLVKDILAGKQRPPAPNPKLRPLSERPVKTVARVEPPKRETIEGLEAKSGWRTEEWGNPAKTDIVQGARARGKLLQVRRAAGQKDKVAVANIFDLDVAKYAALSLDVLNDSPARVQLALGLNTTDEWAYFESRPIEILPGKQLVSVCISTVSSDYKSGTTEWAYEASVKDADQMKKLVLLAYDLADKGTLVFDNIRFTSGGFQRVVKLPHGGGEARGASWVDFDSDGDLDAYVCAGSGNRLYRNEGQGTFEDVTGEVGLAGGSRGATWADYNGDGSPDLLLSTPALFTNQDGKFVNHTSLLPKWRGYNTEGSGWLDYDGDGHPDALISNGQYGLMLFRNEGKGPNWFTDASKKAGLGPGGPGQGNGDFLAVGDLDGDGYVEFAYNYGKGIVARNEDGERFVPYQESGISYVTGNERKIGLAFGDLDNDGDLDLAVPQVTSVRLFRNKDDGTFEDIAAKSPDLATWQGKCFSAAWADIDLDGNLDLVISDLAASARVLLGDGKGRFADASANLGLRDRSEARGLTGLAVADFDNDGDLDILANSMHSAAYVFVNHLPRRAKRTFLKVAPQAATGVVGAAVRVFSPAGQILGIREINGGENAGSQGPPYAFFGVAPGPYRLSVCFTDGSVVQKNVNVSDNGLSVVVSND